MVSMHLKTEYLVQDIIISTQDRDNVNSNMDAELLAVNVALICCLVLSDSKGNSVVWFGPPKQLVISHILNNTPGKRRQKDCLPVTLAHYNVTGNEMADDVVKTALRMFLVRAPKYSLSKFKIMTTVVIYKGWEVTDKGKHLYIIQVKPSVTNNYYAISRCIAIFVAKVRTEHIVTQQYLHHFNFKEYPKC